MNIIFFGNTPYSLIGATILHAKLGISTIVTIPDRPDKRARLTQSPLKTFGIVNNIPVLEVNKLDEETINKIASMQPDFLVVEDYGLILPKRLLQIPRLAPLNIHHSLLPKYRGPAPAPTAILAGETQSGVTIIHMTDKVDAGDIYAQKEYTLKPNETTDSLLTILNELGGHLVIEVIQNILKGTAIRQKQKEHEATFTSFMKKSDGYFDSNNPPAKEQLDRMIRAYYPWPTAWTRFNIASKNDLPYGKADEAISSSTQGKLIKFLPSSSHRFTRQNDDMFCVQMEGKKPITLKDFINGYPEMKNVMNKLLDE